jgi:hypothetical protein
MPPTPQQVIRRERIEGLIALAAPFLDLMLSVGERVSKTVGPEDEYYPIRSAGEAFSLPESRPAASSAGSRPSGPEPERVGWPPE